MNPKMLFWVKKILLTLIFLSLFYLTLEVKREELPSTMVYARVLVLFVLSLIYQHLSARIKV